MQDLVNIDYDKDESDHYVKKSALKLSDIWNHRPMKDRFENVVDGNKIPEYSHTKHKHYVTEFVREKSKHTNEKENIRKNPYDSRIQKLQNV